MPDPSGPDFSLAGRRVLVTGAGRGLGRGLATAICAAGAHVVGVARTAEQLAETGAVAGDRFAALPWDLAETSRSGELVARATQLDGPIDAVVHAAGVQHRADADAFTVDEWRQVLAVNLETPFFLSTALHRAQLAAGRHGTHLFIGSLASSLGLPRVSAYAASKSAVLGVVRSLAVEWAPLGSRVNCLAPGYYATEMTADLLADGDRQAWVLGRIPMGRLGVADDLGGAAVFLLSDAAGYITGQLLSVDGGWLAA